ncbi:MAG: radical SAM protein, partial [Candidatus Celaenobacter polaris]|nr:radical SAM protein [Candidatus Celaenobacter polaris]
IQASVAGVARDPKLIELMARAGFKIVFLGIENIKKSNVEFLSKDRHVLDQTSNAIDLLRKNKLIVVGGFILGNPEDTQEILMDHCEFAIENRIDVPLFMLLTPFLKTRVREKIIPEGLLTNPDDFCFYDLSHANIRTHYLSSEDLNFIKNNMYGKINDLRSLKHNLVKFHYPFHLLSLIVNELPKSAMNILRRFLYSDYEYESYKAGRIREINRMSRWLLDKKSVIQNQTQSSFHIN